MQNNDNVFYFDSFGVEHIPKEINAFINSNNDNNNNNKKKKKKKKKNVIIFRIEAYDSIMCGYFLLVLLVLCIQEKL